MLQARARARGPLLLAIGQAKVSTCGLDNIGRKDGGFSGVLMNDPVLVKGMRRGQRNEFQETQITDWTYMRSGKIVGSDTMLPLLMRLPPEEAARYRAMLADP